MKLFNFILQATLCCGLVYSIFTIQSLQKSVSNLAQNKDEKISDEIMQSASVPPINMLENISEILHKQESLEKLVAMLSKRIVDQEPIAMGHSDSRPNKNSDLTLEDVPEGEPKGVDTPAPELVFTKENFDENWREYAETQILQQLESLDPNKFSLYHVECRTTLCQLNLAVHENTPSSALELAELTPWQGKTHIKLNSLDSQTEAVIFISRDERSQ